MQNPEQEQPSAPSPPCSLWTARLSNEHRSPVQIAATVQDIEAATQALSLPKPEADERINAFRTPVTAEVLNRPVGGT